MHGHKRLIFSTLKVVSTHRPQSPIIFTIKHLHYMEKTFSRVYSAKDITVILTLIIGGCILILLPTASSINILGFFMIIAGIILGIFMKTGYKDVETGVRYCKTEHYFSSSKRDELKKAISGNPKKSDLFQEDSGSSLRMDIYHSAKSGKAYIQLLEYIPHSYEPFTLMYEHDLKNVSEIIRK